MIKELVFKGPVNSHLEITFDSINESCCFEIDHPWRGDTENGFGIRSEFWLSKEEISKLGSWLMLITDSK